MVYDGIMRPKQLLVTLFIGVQMSTAFPVFAQDPIPTVTLPQPPVPAPGEPDVGAAISPMKKGNIAPFTGILLSPKAAATIIANLNALQEQIKVEVDHARAEEQAKCDFRVSETTTRLETDKKILRAQVDEQGKRIVIITDQLKKEETSRPNTSLWVGVGTGVGFVLGVAATVLTVYAVNQASK